MAILNSALGSEQKVLRSVPEKIFKRRHCLLLLILACLHFAMPAARTQDGGTEYKLKAVFLFNFAQFVDWPSQAFPSPDAPLVIGILGKDPFGTILDETVQNETVKGHKLKLERYRTLAEVKHCQILFVSNAETGDLSNILESLRGKPILTVGESDGFASRGGMIRFVTQNQKIKLRVNMDAVTESGLAISSKLLRLAEVVRNGKAQ